MTDIVIHEHTREAWLGKLVEIWRPYFERLGYPLPSKLYVSVGIPSRQTKHIGRCYPQIYSDDRAPHIFIHPVMSDPIRVAGTLVHELCHAALDCEGGHGAEFKKLATACGLVGKMTETIEGPAFIAMMEGVLQQIGPYPHSALRAGKSTRNANTRMFRSQCAECGYTVRVSRTWLKVAVPICPNSGCHSYQEPMTVEERALAREYRGPGFTRPDFET